MLTQSKLCINFSKNTKTFEKRMKMRGLHTLLEALEKCEAYKRQNVHPGHGRTRRRRRIKDESVSGARHSRRPEEAAVGSVWASAGRIKNVLVLFLSRTNRVRCAGTRASLFQKFVYRERVACSQTTPHVARNTWMSVGDTHLQKGRASQGGQATRRDEVRRGHRCRRRRSTKLICVGSATLASVRRSRNRSRLGVGRAHQNCSSTVLE